jgi:hypothetical protein
MGKFQKTSLWPLILHHTLRNSASDDLDSFIFTFKAESDKVDTEPEVEWESVSWKSKGSLITSVCRVAININVGRMACETRQCSHCQ